ncbi:uncharacterized protein LOC123317164 [Coccinella septempunctata]|uniref:uncharacterized protein LOC123317164 n=1 Tax=Coccinella septempunctata TaxID=41139 RepID=UPI001D078A80|nr:uncharacterized protein LOC123317164 [Coccinella septempunctata]
MCSVKFVLYFSVFLSGFFLTTEGVGVKSCYYCNGNCTEPKLVNCTRPESGCIAYEVKQNNNTDIFKNCFASSTWNCDRVKKWVSNKHLRISVTSCQVCMENDCNKNIFFRIKNSSTSVSLSTPLLYFLFFRLLLLR